MLLPTNTLQIRDASPARDLSSASSSNACTGKHKDDAACQKPTNNDSLEIGLGVAIPVVMIILVLGFFLFRNYRKEKKESLEHDPDFDETGDATALPDFPAFTNEGTFDKNGSSVRMAMNPGYPLMNLPNLSNSESRSINSSKFKESIEGSQRKVYPDAFVLPYQNQMGSKASLDEFAKNSIDNREFYRTFRRDLDQYSSQNAGFYSERSSPQKSGLRNEKIVPKALVSKSTEPDYTNLPNNSTSLFNTALEGTDVSSNEKPTRAQFGVEYENELDLAINTTLPSSNVAARNAFDTDSELESVEDDESVETHKDLARAEHDIKQSIVNSLGDNTQVNSGPKHNLEIRDTPGIAPSVKGADSRIDTGGDSSSDVAHESGDESDQETINSKNNDVLSPFADTHEVHEALNVKQSKEPRISQFDLMKNVSDDEADDKEKLTEEQKEELARMKSVYKVYFDRTNSVVSERKTDSMGGHQFQVDTSQPVPNIDIDNLRINSDLKGDTRYDKRYTTASSIYEDFNPMNGESLPGLQLPRMNGQPTGAHQFQQQHGQHDQVQHMQHQLPPDQQQNQHHRQPWQKANEGYFPQFKENGEPASPTSPQDMTPLKSLPYASDIRNSTIETFTDYQPRVKVMSPGVKHNAHFDDTLNSPQISQNSFGSQNVGSHQELPPVINNVYGGRPTPSASQLSRTSVVMLNPVNEITSLRKFKPAGSLPSGMGNAAYNSDKSYAEDDLIPGNRKSAVRRMMNTNF